MIKNKYIGLHMLLLIYSCGGIFSKLASRENFLSLKFCIFYGCLLLILMVYAIGWQQIIKKMPISMAFSNKAINIIWGMLWGALFFGEKITLGKIIGVMFVGIGIIIFNRERQETDEK